MHVCCRVDEYNNIADCHQSGDGQCGEGYSSVYVTLSGSSGPSPPHFTPAPYAPGSAAPPPHPYRTPAPYAPATGAPPPHPYGTAAPAPSEGSSCFDNSRFPFDHDGQCIFTEPNGCINTQSKGYIMCGIDNCAPGWEHCDPRKGS
jgi:hypothetical protein